MPAPTLHQPLYRQRRATTRIESIGYAEGAKRKINVIVSNRTGKPALLERTEEIIP
jgi:general secretion pathway protein K